MEAEIKAAHKVFGCFATQEEFEVWDLKRRQEKAHWDMVSRLNYAREEGEEKGRAGEKLEIAHKMREMGDSLEKICAVTGLDIETIQGLNC